MFVENGNATAPPAEEPDDKAAFNVHDKKHRCCCRLFHVLRVTLLLAIMDSCIVVIQAISITTGIQDIGGTRLLGFWKFHTTCYIIALCCAFVAMFWVQNSKLFIPWIVVLALTTIGLAIYTCMLFILGLLLQQGWFVAYLFDDEDSQRAKYMSGLDQATGSVAILSAVLLIVAVPTVIFLIWHTYAVYLGYRYLKDREQAGYTGGLSGGVVLRKAENFEVRVVQGDVRPPSGTTGTTTGEAPPAYETVITAKQ